MCLTTVVQLGGNFHEVAHGAQSITGLEVARLQEQCNQHCLRDRPRVIKDPSLPAASLLLPLPSRRKIPDPQNMQQDNRNLAFKDTKSHVHAFFLTQRAYVFFVLQCLEVLKPNVRISHGFPCITFSCLAFKYVSSNLASHLK